MENNELTDHSYDGIQEFDNPLPGWWKWMFIGSIIFSVFYAMYFHIGAPGRSVIDGYDMALDASMRKQFETLGDLKPDAATIVKFSQDDSWRKVGASVFRANCVSCHGRNAEGQVGPNLTDEYYKNVRQVEDIAKVIIKGAGNGAMPAWSTRLNETEIVLVSAYVASLRGQNVPGKNPDGIEIAPWPEPVAGSDSEQNAAPESSGEAAGDSTATS